MPSPSMSSFHSYSNSSSPTADLINSHNSNNSVPMSGGSGLLLRCFSPSSSNRYAAASCGNGNSGQNYFSKSPSPTRKLFVARRSMSPIPACSLRPTSLNTNCKRKFSDVDQGNSNDSLSTVYSPKRSNIDAHNQHQSQQQQQEFVEPLLIFTGNGHNNNNNNSTSTMNSNNNNNSNNNGGSSSISNQNLARTLNRYDYDYDCI